MYELEHLIGLNLNTKLEHDQFLMCVDFLH